MKGLQRDPQFRTFHNECRGKVVALYLFHLRKWLRIGDYCKKCGAVKLYDEYEWGVKEKKV